MSKTLHGHSDFLDSEFEFTVQGVKLTVMSGLISLSSELGRPIEDVLHTHSWFELFYVSSGELHCTFGEDEFNLHTGEMMLVPPGKEHFTKGVNGETEIYVFNFSAVLSKEAKQDFTVGNIFSKLLQIEEYYRFIPNKECIHSAISLGNALETGMSLLSGTYLWELLLQIGFLTVYESKPDPETHSDNNISRIYKLETLFSNYCCSHLSLSDLATELNLSPRQLSRIIQKQYGCSFREKITAMRMNAAAYLLLSTKKVFQQ